MAALTTRPLKDLLERPFCPKGAKEKDLGVADEEALNPANDTKPFAEIVDAVNWAVAISTFKYKKTINLT